MFKPVIDINESTIKQFLETIRPEDLEMRKQIDFGYTYDGKIIEMFQLRPKWDNPKEIIQIPFAKIRYYKSKNEWKLYWMRGNLKWDVYQPFPSSSYLAQILDHIKVDKFGCFFG